jgi:hypothetical protein
MHFISVYMQLNLKMDYVFFDTIWRAVQKSAGVEIDLQLLSTSLDDFVSSYLNTIKCSGYGTFVHRSNLSNTCIRYSCDRHSKPSGKSTGEPTQTRANKCPAYISFEEVVKGSRRGVVIRKSLGHSGHDPLVVEQWKVNRICPERTSFILCGREKEE